MPTGAITGYVDVAQLVLYAFWIFFAGLIIYLRREDKREGYPLESDRSGHVRVVGFPAMPRLKTYLLPGGGTHTSPTAAPAAVALRASPVGSWPGAPLQPTGNPMQDGVGPAAYAQRKDIPDVTYDGQLRIVPLRATAAYAVDSNDPDPRGMNVFGADGQVGGTVRDLWVDRSEHTLRYLEVDVPTNADTRRVLLPINYTRIRGGKRRVDVHAILAAQFADAPVLASPDQVTRREEDRICAYYAGGTLYAEPSRAEPFV